MEQENWNVTTQRFVAFFDIMGFKDLVERSSHSDVVLKLQALKRALKTLERAQKKQDFVKDFEIGESRAVTFSDSIIIFSKSDTVNDAHKIIIDSAWLIKKALEIGIGIKGAISYGEVTADFTNSLFFGRPIIDAYLLHDQLYLYSAILDHNFEKKIKSLSLKKEFINSFILYKANIKSGKVFHKLICPLFESAINEQIACVEKIYETVSGNPRIYVDNTLDFLNFALQETKKRKDTVA